MTRLQKLIHQSRSPLTHNYYWLWDELQRQLRCLCSAKGERDLFACGYWLIKTVVLTCIVHDTTEYFTEPFYDYCRIFDQVRRAWKPTKCTLRRERANLHDAFRLFCLTRENRLRTCRYQRYVARLDNGEESSRNLSEFIRADNEAPKEAMTLVLQSIHDLKSDAASVKAFEREK